MLSQCVAAEQSNIADCVVITASLLRCGAQLVYAQVSQENIPLGPLATLMPLLQMAGVLNDNNIKNALKQASSSVGLVWWRCCLRTPAYTWNQAASRHYLGFARSLCDVTTYSPPSWPV